MPRHVARLCLSARQPGRAASRAVAPCGGCRAWLVVTRDTRRTRSSRRGRHAARCTASERGRRSAVAEARRASRRRLPRGRPDRPRAHAVASRFDGAPLRRPSPATRWPPRCSPTACGWSAARSNTTARAASCRPARRSRTRWSNCATARGASPTRAATVAELYDGLVAQSQNRFPSLRFDLMASNSLVGAAAAAPASTTRPSCGRPRSGSGSTSR